MLQYAIKTWELAENDLQTSRVLLRLNEPVYYRNICYHSQQAAEKFLKALIAYHAVNAPRTHRFRAILATIQSIIPSFPDIDLNDLEDYSVLIRYADYQEAEPDADEAASAIATAEEVRNVVSAFLPWRLA